MSERKASFFLALIDKISGPARKMAQSIASLEKAERAGKQAAEAETKAVATLGAAASTAARNVEKLATAERKAAGARRAMGPVYRPDQAGLYAGQVGKRAFGPVHRPNQANQYAGQVGKDYFGPVYRPEQAGIAYAGQVGGAQFGPAFDRSLAGVSHQGPVFDKALAGVSHAGPVHRPDLAGVHGPAHNPALAGSSQGFIGPRRASTGERLTSQLVGGAKDFAAWNSAMGEARDKMADFFATFARTPLGMLAKGLGAIAGGIFELAQSLASAALDAAKLTLALGVIAGGLFTKKVLELASFAQKSAVALTALGHSAYQGAVEFNQARKIAKELGSGVEETTHQFIELRAAQFGAGEAETWLKLGKDLQGVTGDAEGAARAIRAVTQIKAKGKLQAEELLQLSEAGLSLELVYKALGEQSGKTTAQIQADMKKGNVTGNQGLNAIQAALMGKLHEKNAGDFAKNVSNSTMGGVWEQLKNAPDNFMLDVGMKIDTSPILAGMRAILKAFTGSDGLKAVWFVQAMVNGIGRLLPLLVDFAEGFAGGFGDILAALSEVTGGANLKSMAKTAGDWLAKFFARAIKFTTEAVPYIVDAVTKFTEGLDVSGFAESMKSFDWKLFAENLVTIAGALGQIMNFTAQFLAPANKRTGTAATVTDYLARGGAGLNDTEADLLATGGTKKFLKTFHADSLVSEERATAIDNWVDDLIGRPRRSEGPTATLSPAAAAAGGSKSITSTVNVTGANGDPELIGRAVGKHVDAHLNRLADTGLTEATP